MIVLVILFTASRVILCIIYAHISVYAFVSHRCFPEFLTRCLVSCDPSMSRFAAIQIHGILTNPTHRSLHNIQGI